MKSSTERACCVRVCEKINSFDNQGVATCRNKIASFSGAAQ